MRQFIYKSALDDVSTTMNPAVEDDHKPNRSHLSVGTKYSAVNIT